MKIQNFVRDNAYFSALRDRDRPINTEDLDLQFAILENFIDTKIGPVVDGLANNRLLGSTAVEDLECYLENIGDGNTRWSKIKFDSLTDHSLTWAKLRKAAEGTILAAGQVTFQPVATSFSYTFLTSNTNDVPVYSYLKNNHFAIRTLDGDKVDYQTIGIEHFAPNVIGADIDDNSITEINILNQAVTGAKIADGAIDDSKIAVALLNRRNNNAVWGNRSINAGKLRANSLNELNVARLFFGNVALNQNAKNISRTLLTKIDQVIPNNGVNLAASVKIFPQYHIADGAIELRHIKPQSFRFTGLNPNINGEQAYSGKFFQFLRKEHLSPRLKQLIGLN